MSKLIDLTGQKFGELTVIEYVGKTKSRSSLWRCQCSCGKETIVQGGNLKTGNTTSCGCVKQERLLKSLTKHGKRHTRIYEIWCAMKRRCNNPHVKAYNRYGGRGIIVCEEWNDFQNFYNWSMENGYREDLSIDRINNNGNYEPTNCRWTDMETQANNTSSNHHLTFNGKTLTLAQWSKETNLPIGERIGYGLSTEEALTFPLNYDRKVFEYNGESHTIAEWSRIKNIGYHTLYNRLILLKWDIEDALEKPARKTK